MVAREPGHRARRLTERDGSVARPQPAFAPPVVMGDRLRRARVLHDATEGGALPEMIARLQGQLLPVPANPRRAAVDGGAQHLHAEEVEMEGAEVRSGLRGDLRSAHQAAAAGVVGQGQGVVGDVVAAVAELREVRVTGACGTGVPAPEHRARCLRPSGVRACTSTRPRICAGRGPRPTAAAAVGLRARGECGEQARDREGGQTSGSLHTADHDPAPQRPDLATPCPWPLRRTRLRRPPARLRRRSAMDGTARSGRGDRAARAARPDRGKPGSKIAWRRQQVREALVPVSEPLPRDSEREHRARLVFVGASRGRI